MIRKFPGHDTETPPGQVKLSDYIEAVEDHEARLTQHLTIPPDSCYTIRSDPKYAITTGMSLRDFKDGIGQAYWNRDRETLDRLLESLQEGA